MHFLGHIYLSSQGCVAVVPIGEESPIVQTYSRERGETELDSSILNHIVYYVACTLLYHPEAIRVIQ